MVAAAWPGLVSPRAGRGLETGLGTVLLGMALAEHQGEGIAPVLSFPILVPESIGGTVPAPQIIPGAAPNPV